MNSTLILSGKFAVTCLFAGLSWANVRFKRGELRLDIGIARDHKAEVVDGRSVGALHGRPRFSGNDVDARET